jgi:hypothetical protein
LRDADKIVARLNKNKIITTKQQKAAQNRKTKASHLTQGVVPLGWINEVTAQTQRKQRAE